MAQLVDTCPDNEANMSYNLSASTQASGLLFLVQLRKTKHQHQHEDPLVSIIEDFGPRKISSLKNTIDECSIVSSEQCCSAVAEQGISRPRDEKKVGYRISLLTHAQNVSHLRK
jgi:hypothetical protein